MSDVHNFGDSLERGAAGEEFIARWLSQWGTVDMVEDMEVQRRGIDMILNHDGRPMTLEVKTDYRAAETGNVFLETVSVQTEGGKSSKPGWLFTCSADRLVYYVPGLFIGVYIPQDLVDKYHYSWNANYPIGRAYNRGYHSEGLLVPVGVMSRAAIYKKAIGES